MIQELLAKAEEAVANEEDQLSSIVQWITAVSEAGYQDINRIVRWRDAAYTIKERKIDREYVMNKVDTEFGGIDEFLNEVRYTVSRWCVARDGEEFRPAKRYGLQIIIGGVRFDSSQVDGIRMALLQWIAGVAEFQKNWWVGYPGGSWGYQTFQDGSPELWAVAVGKEAFDTIEEIVKKCEEVASDTIEEFEENEATNAWAILGKYLHKRDKKNGDFPVATEEDQRKLDVMRSFRSAHFSDMATNMLDKVEHVCPDKIQTWYVDEDNMQIATSEEIVKAVRIITDAGWYANQEDTLKIGDKSITVLSATPPYGWDNQFEINKFIDSKWWRGERPQETLYTDNKVSIFAV